MQYIDTTYMARHYTKETRVFKEATRHERGAILLRTGTRALESYLQKPPAAALIAELKINVRDVPG